MRTVFSKRTDVIDRVGFYGSRVQARAQRGSDVDLVFYGAIDDRDVSSIKCDLEDSDLSIFVDVVAYPQITHAKLRSEIDIWMKPLFARSDLSAVV